MAEPRETVLRALRDARKEGVSNAAIVERLAQRPTGPQPALAGVPVEVFVARAVAAGATVSRVTDKAAAAQAITDYLEDRGLVVPRSAFSRSKP